MISEQPIDMSELLAAAANNQSGAVVVFAGVVRADENDGRRVVLIHYDCYHLMASREMDNLVDEIQTASGVHSIRAVHRVGDVAAGEISLGVVVTAGHREAAYEASRKVVDEIKHRVPIWKKEVYDDGSFKWL
jgi:molybdopterin synthase catalytic subunit